MRSSAPGVTLCDMAELTTITALWNGFTGAPGYSRLRFQGRLDQSSLDAAGAGVRAFFLALNAYLQTGWTIGIQPIAQVNDVGTGALTGEVAMTSTPAVVTGTVSNTTAYAGGSGAVVHWITGAFSHGRKVRGRTYLVPLVLASASDGTVSPSFITAMQNAGNALVALAAADLCVWTKTFDDAKPANQIGGLSTPVTGCTVPDRSAQLRTRRS